MLFTNQMYKRIIILFNASMFMFVASSNSLRNAKSTSTVHFKSSRTKYSPP
ncbi:hypothetical protein RJG79_08580 [Mycoplasmatota bacterium WC44]